MENIDVPLPAASPVPVAPVASGTYPSQASAIQQTPATSNENPFGGPPRRTTAVHNVRKRIGSALAALVALVAKFGVAIKALLVALPNLKLLVTAGTALVSVAAYSLF